MYVPTLNTNIERRTCNSVVLGNLEIQLRMFTNLLKESEGEEILNVSLKDKNEIVIFKMFNK